MIGQNSDLENSGGAKFFEIGCSDLYHVTKREAMTEFVDPDRMTKLTDCVEQL